MARVIPVFLQTVKLQFECANPLTYSIVSVCKLLHNKGNIYSHRNGTTKVLKVLQNILSHNQTMG